MKQIISIGLNALLIVAVIWAVSTCHSEKNFRLEEKAEADSAYNSMERYYTALYDSCVNAKSKVDTIVDTIKGKIIYKPIELTRTDSIKIYTAIEELTGDTVDIFQVEYSDTIRTDYFSFFWRARVTGWIDELEFPWFEVYKETIIKEWVINNPPKPQKPKIVKQYKNGLYLYGEAGNNLKGWTEWNSVGGGMEFIHKRGGLAGIGYERYVTFDGSGNKIRGNFLKIKVGYRITR